MSKFLKTFFLIAGAALYLNLGWAYGTWYYDNVLYQEPDTFAEEVVAGAWDMYSQPDTPAADQHSKIRSQGSFSIVWPVWAGLTILSWVVFGVYKLLWLIFAGGIAKLFGVG